MVHIFVDRDSVAAIVDVNMPTPVFNILLVCLHGLGEQRGRSLFVHVVTIHVNIGYLAQLQFK